MKTLAAIALIFICFQTRAQDTLYWDMATDTYLTEKPAPYPLTKLFNDADKDFKADPNYLFDEIDYTLPKPNAQKTFWEKHKRAFAVMGVQMLSLSLEATGDALFDMGKNEGNLSKMQWGHTLTAAGYGSLILAIPLLELKRSDAIPFTVSWFTKRYGAFDALYNTTAGLPLLYAGTTSTSDNYLSRMPPGGRLFTKSLTFGFSIAFDIKNF